MSGDGCGDSSGTCDYSFDNSTTDHCTDYECAVNDTNDCSCADETNNHVSDDNDCDKEISSHHQSYSSGLLESNIDYTTNNVAVGIDDDRYYNNSEPWTPDYLPKIWIFLLGSFGIIFIHVVATVR